MYRPDVAPRAERDLQQLARQNRQAYGRVLEAIHSLVPEPRPPGCNALVGQPGWRIRVGTHRVIYDIDDDAMAITILGVAHRRDVYRRT